MKRETEERWQRQRQHHPRASKGENQAPRVLDSTDLASDGEAHCGGHSHGRLHRGRSHLAGLVHAGEDCSRPKELRSREIPTLESPKMLAERMGGTPVQCWARNTEKAWSVIPPGRDVPTRPTYWRRKPVSKGRR